MKSTTTERPLEKFLTLLKEYKELATALAFFAGGILWIFGYFATKDEVHALRDATSTQNKILNCLLQTHVRLLQGEQEAKSYRDDLTYIMEELRKLNPGNSQVSGDVIREIVKLEQQRDEDTKKLNDADRAITEANEVIRFEKCAK